MRPDPSSVQDAAEAILGLLALRQQGKTICPSEAARVIARDEDFRAHMGVVRDAARMLVARDRVEVLQGGKVVDLDHAHGPVRLRAPSGDRLPSRPPR